MNRILVPWKRGFGNPSRATIVAVVGCALACSDPAPPAAPSAKDAASAAEHATAPPRMPTGETITHTLRFPAPATHTVEVESVFPATGDSLELMMAVWTPGSYLVREYAQHVIDLRASSVDGAPLAVEKTRKNRWRIATGGADHVVVRYRVYAYDLSVRTNFVTDDMALINGAATFLAIAGDGSHPHDVMIVLPTQWKTVATAMAAHPSGEPHRYLAADFDTLVDSPMIAGNPELSTFSVGGIEHTLATFGGTDVWDQEQAAADLKKAVTEVTAMWGVIPYDHYVFLNIAKSGGGGGLEHKASTTMITSRFATSTHEGEIDWLGLASHEFFHAWNVKRMRPKALGPFDYERENYTRSLWIAEGITSYYGTLLLSRAGLITEGEYLKALSRAIKHLETLPGRKLQPLSRSSYDAWIEQYRPDENSRNTAVSYYVKGELVGFLLDAKIRRETAGKKSLDDVMRATYAAFSGDHGYTPADFLAQCEHVAGAELDDFFARYVDGTAELDYQPALDYFGLELQENQSPGETSARDADENDDDETAGWLGIRTETRGESAVIRSMDSGTPAYGAGLSAGDEILAIDGYRVTADELSRRLKDYRPGDAVKVLIARRDRILEIPVTLGTEPKATYALSVRRGARAAQNSHRRAWLH